MNSSGLPLSPLERLHGELPQLHAADIVLVRHKKNLTRSLLRKVTNSYWDHSTLIMFGKKPERGYNNNIIIEAIQYGISSSLRRGVEIHRLDKYLYDPEKYDIGIKRVTWLDDEMRDRVRAFMLMNVDSPYYPLYLSKFLLAALLPSYAKRVLRRQRYSCSGLVQKAFYEAADWETRSRLIFGNPSYTPIELQEITSPADIARSKQCTWVWNRH